MFTDGEVEKNSMEFKRALCFVPSSTGFSAFSIASYTVAIPKGEFLKSVLLQTRPNGLAIY